MNTNQTLKPSTITSANGEHFGALKQGSQVVWTCKEVCHFNGHVERTRNAQSISALQCAKNQLTERAQAAMWATETPALAIISDGADAWGAIEA